MHAYTLSYDKFKEPNNQSSMASEKTHRGIARRILKENEPIKDGNAKLKTELWGMVVKKRFTYPRAHFIEEIFTLSHLPDKCGDKSSSCC